MGQVRRRLHALVLPFPIQGHITPMLHLSQHLASSYGFLITFVNTEYNQKAFEKGHPDGAGPDIHMVGLSDGLPLDASRCSLEDTSKVMQSLPIHMKPQLQQLLLQLHASPTPVSCIIADIFMPWVHSLDIHSLDSSSTALTSNVLPPLVGFHVSSISAFALISRLPHLITSGQISPHDGSVRNTARDRVSVIPELLEMEAGSIPWCSGSTQDDTHLLHFLTVVQKHVPLLKGLLFNSFWELEGKIADALEEETKVKMLPVGPLLLALEGGGSADAVKEGVPAEDRCGGGGAVLSSRDRECWEWLDPKPKGSVLYISFGTTAWLSADELHELALGIEAAQVPFMWVLRADLVMRGSSDGGQYCGLPPGFVERTKDLAFFTPWAPQTLVLSHPSVGAFLTHGGWNSFVEAICNGVPMLTWPYAFDQKGNCQHIVEDWKVGLALRKCGEGGSPQHQVVGRQEVAKLVTCLMSKGAEGEQMRERAASLQRQARAAFAEGGSSHKSLQEFIHSISVW